MAELQIWGSIIGIAVLLLSNLYQRTKLERRVSELEDELWNSHRE